MVDEEHAVAHVYMTGPVPPATNGDSGGAIYEKTAPLSNLSFPLGVGTPVIQDADSPDMNNVTSTKQNVTSSTGLVILASNDSTNRYWWQYNALGGTPPPTLPPVADFSASPTAGAAPLQVQFVDQSTNLPTSWAWDFDNDGTIDSTARNPTFTYPTAGTYTVALTATNGGGSDTKTKPSLISVGQPLTFTTVTPVADAYTSQAKPTKNYGTDVNLRVRSSTGSFRSYLKFTVGGLSGTVQSAKLRLWVNDASPDGGSVYAVGSTWTESGTGSITWNTAPALPGSPIKSIGATSALGTWTEVDLGPVVSANGTYSFALVSASSNSAYYSSREGTHAPQLVIGVDGGQPPPPAPPVAAFSASPTSVDAPLTVQFTDQSSNSPTSWAWDFENDGTVDSTAQNPSFQYTTAGSYSVKLSVSNNDGSDSITKSSLISVAVAPPPPPTTTFTATADTRVIQSSPSSKTGGTDVSLRVRLDATGSYHSYVRFNLTGISGTVTSAKLRLWCTDASPDGGTVYPTSGAWDEATTSWSNAPAATGGAAGSAGAVSVGAWAEFDVTSLVTSNGQVDLLVADGNTNSAYYSSREGTAPPQLVVTTSP
jgi:PKD repeat protein